MTLLHNFALLAERAIPELNTMARLFRHARVGTQVLSLHNDDENKVFGVTFRTPPTDSTGLPHIMEHSVLCGSRKYPVKEPFVELVKGSLNTFVNAMTYPDKTVYPVASQNLKDFYNLVDVYLDAVFHPNLTPFTLKQEGWHYELDDPALPLTYKGVVFNEMKGAYSDPDNVLERYVQQSLFPDTSYGVDSGGDPVDIPNLSWEQFKGFYDAYYHPSNALVYFYGDDPLEERLHIIDSCLSEFEPRQVGDSAIALQAPFDAPRRFEHAYAVSVDSDTSQKGYVTVNWLLAENNDPEQTLALGILNHILVGTPASPLRKALLDSGLGEDLAGAGVEPDLRQITFSTGLKGVAEEDYGAVEALVLETLERIVRERFDAEMIEAGVNTVEFALRENNTGRFPRGLLLMLRALRFWLHDGDPVAPLAFEAPLSAIKARLAAGEAYFEGLVERLLVRNPHRSTVVLRPDPAFGERQEADERARLDAARAAMSAEELARIVADTQALKRMQETPDSPEALATIPMLRLDDLDRENKVVPLEVSAMHGVPVLYHDLFTNGILYLDLGFNLHALPQEALPYMGLFGRVLLEMGTASEDYVRLAQRIGRRTGGIQPATYTSMTLDRSASVAWGFLRSKATLAQVDDLLAILRDVLLTVRLDNTERFRQIVLEEKASQEAGLLPMGHVVARGRLQAQFNEADWAAEQMEGVDYLLFLRQLIGQIETDWPAVQRTLEGIRQHLVKRAALLCNVTVDAQNWSSVAPKLAEFLAALPTGEAVLPRWSPALGTVVVEGMTVPAQVNYVAKGADLYALGYLAHGSILPVLNYLRTTWLWERVRVHGGAYGAFVTFDWRSGALAYFSYRDPNLTQTLETFDRSGQFLRELTLPDEELTKSIIGVIGVMDTYQFPDAKGFSSMTRYLTGETDAHRQRVREQVLGTTREHFRQFADVLDQVNAAGTVVVLGGADAIDTANAASGGQWRVFPVL